MPVDNRLSYLTFMEPCIARCVFYITNEMQLIQRSLLLSSLVWMGWNLFQPLHTSGRQQESMTIPKAEHTVFNLLMMDGKTARKIWSDDNNKEYFISCISLVIQNTRLNYVNMSHTQSY